jgi:hypothetical protein
MASKKWIAAIVVALSLAAAACGTVGPENNVTQTFTGTLQPFINDFKEFTFSVGKSGEYSVKIASLNPPKNLFLEVYFGTPGSLGCSPIQDNISAYPGYTALNGAIQKGTWCVGIRDLGSLEQTRDFVLEVSHP